MIPSDLNPMNDQSTMGKILEYMAFELPVVLFDLTEGKRSAADAALYAQPNDPVRSESDERSVDNGKDSGIHGVRVAGGAVRFNRRKALGGGRRSLRSAE